MASLTYTAHMARNTIKYGGAGLAIFTVLWMVGSAAIAAYKAAHPPYVKPNIKYGILPAIVFPEKQFEKKNFTAELANDKFPAFKDQARVYFVARPISTILALEQDKKTAKQLGFTIEPTPLSEKLYEFKNSVTNQTLTMNVVEGSFHLKYPYETDQMLLNPEKVPDKTEAISKSKSYLTTAGKYAKDLEEGEKKVSFWKIEYAGLKSVSSLSEANVTRVDFFRKNLEGDFKIVSADPSSSQVSVLVTGSTVEGKKIVEVNYRYANIDRESFGTYPIKTAEQAFMELKNGNYWPAVDSPNTSTVIRKITLAYFEPVTLTNYMQPIFVFEGDGNFVGYVPAITSTYIQ